MKFTVTIPTRDTYSVYVLLLKHQDIYLHVDHTVVTSN